MVMRLIVCSGVEVRLQAVRRLGWLVVAGSLAVVASGLAAQVATAASTPRPLELSDLMKFRTIDQTVVSDDGAWVAYALWPDRGDGEVVVRSTQAETEYRIPRGTEPAISADSGWVAALVKPPLEQIEKAKEKGKDKEKGPKTGLALLDLSDGSLVGVERVEKLVFSEDGRWLAYQHFKEEPEEKEQGEAEPEEPEEKEQGEAEPEEPEEKEEHLGSTLVLRQLASGSEIRIEYVSGFGFDAISAHLAYAVAAPEGKGNGLLIRLLGDEVCAAQPVHQSESGRYTALTWPEEEAGSLAFVAAVQEEDGPGDADLWVWDPDSRQARPVATSADAPEGWFVPWANEVAWSQDRARLFFGYKPVAEKPDKKGETEGQTEGDEDETPFDPYDLDAIVAEGGVDVWHHSDPIINPHQKKRWDKEKDRIYRAVAHMGSGQLVRLADGDMKEVDPSDNPRSVLGRASGSYLRELTWDGSYHDIYLVSLRDGSRQLVTRRLGSEPSLSPDGRYVVYYCDRHWHLFDGDSGTTRSLTGGLETPFANEDHDYPKPSPGYGVAGWVEGDRAVLIYDKYDIWLFPTVQARPVSLTQGRGRLQDYTFRIVDLDQDRDHLFAGERLLLTAEHRSRKQVGFYRAQVDEPGVGRLLEGDNRLSFVAKAKDADRIIYTRETYNEFPDLRGADLAFASSRRLSDANPQIADFAWGTAELVDWRSADGIRLQGVLIRPGNYQPGQRYPVLVYYYRFFSQRLHQFNEPVVNHRPSFPVYASHGYAVFLPDIRFAVGRPGFSATKCLVPGIQKLIDMGLADPDAIGLHGHSWSGYQTAFVVTQTDIFAAAVAGAPVSNMTSAYSGIRWKTGMARQFQYEMSQSRIGGSLWQARDRYIENSPVFFADHINTPLLIQHGDVDGAVPWYQSIELYLALRRLGKDCIFLQYRDEPHHLKRYPNKLDYSIKMRQFFDHHLKGEPAPAWMSEGVAYRGE